MKKTRCSLLALLLISATAVTAQNTTGSNNAAEKKEIIIEEKSSGKNEKMVIVIDGDNITIDGQPADKYKGNKRIIIDDDVFINGDEVHLPRNGRMYMRGFGGADRAVLGVMTEKAGQGAKIAKVNKESAAEKAGLKEGDVITKVNKKTINEYRDLAAIIGELQPNDVAGITFLRDGKERNVTATLGKSEAPMAMDWNMDSKNHRYQFRMDPPMAMAAPGPPHAPGAPKLPNTPMSARPFLFNDGDMWMFKDDKPRYGMSIEDNADGDGVKITAVDAASNAMKAGMKQNDIITEVEGKPVKGTDEFIAALEDAADKSSISIKVLRNGANESLLLKVPKRIKKADL